MAGAIMDKVWGLFGMDQGETEEVEDEDVYEYEDKEDFLKFVDLVIKKDLIE